MPPPSYCSKVSTRSAGDDEPDFDGIDNSKSEISNYSEATTNEECDSEEKYESVGIVKSLLGPSLEDAVLRTLEFGKSLIQKTEENEPKKMVKQSKKDVLEKPEGQSCGFLMEGGESRRGVNECKMCPEGRTTRKRIVFTAETDKDILYQKPNNAIKKLTNVSKIRSLDSDLKQVSPSPEKIKRQLEALIQINRDDPTDHVLNWNVMSKTPKLPMEMTVMPSFCNYKNETDLNCSSSCEVQSQNSRRNNDGDQCSTSRLRTAVKKRLGAPNKICQAPEFLSNALGPTLDVSIIDNLKMMRDIFKCDSAKGEGMPSREEPMRRMTTSAQMRAEVEVRLQRSEEEMACRIEALQKRIEELEQKEECLMRQIEEEEQERECKRKLFEEEEHRLCSMKACLEELAEQRGKECGVKVPITEAVFEAKYECLQQRIAAEEEKLTRLKEQYETYKREICEARNKKEALKRNKSLLDAWDVIASRVCHTRLPSFSKAYSLERKNFQPSDASGGIHCCLPVQMNQTLLESPRSCCGNSGSGRKSRSRSRCESKSSNRCQSNVEFCWHAQTPSPTRCRKKHEDIPFPIQRDITCGLHQSLKTCSCSQEVKMEGVITGSSDDDLLRKSGGHREQRHPQIHTCCYTSNPDTSAEVLLRKPPCGKTPCRSKSDTTLRNKCAKIVKVMWAVTRINIFQDNCRTYEVMDATCTPPACTPAKTEGIFVVKSAPKKGCQTSPKGKCNASFSGV